MPRKSPAGLNELLAREDARIESHATMEISIDNDDIRRDYYFASAKIFFRGVNWEPLLKQDSQIKSSLTRSSDRSTVELFNADTEIGREFLSLGGAVTGALTKVGRYWKDLDSGMEFHDILLTGPLVAPPVNEDVVAISSVSDPYARISVGAHRRLALLCQWQFRNPFTCGYNGSLLSCDFTLNGAGGCDGRHGSLKMAKNGSFAFLNSQSRLVTS
jgi:hypothetical protein